MKEENRGGRRTRHARCWFFAARDRKEEKKKKKEDKLFTTRVKLIPMFFMHYFISGVEFAFSLRFVSRFCYVFFFFLITWPYI